MGEKFQASWCKIKETSEQHIKWWSWSVPQRSWDGPGKVHKLRLFKACHKWCDNYALVISYTFKAVSSSIAYTVVGRSSWQPDSDTLLKIKWELFNQVYWCGGAFIFRESWLAGKLKDNLGLPQLPFFKLKNQAKTQHPCLLGMQACQMNILPWATQWLFVVLVENLGLQAWIKKTIRCWSLGRSEILLFNSISLAFRPEILVSPA